MCNQHPELVEIASYRYEDYYYGNDGSERYTSWVGGTPPPNWRSYSCYYLYGDGRIIDRPQGFGKEIITWPKSKEQLKKFFSHDTDVLWLYIETYRTLIGKNITPHVSDFIEKDIKSPDTDCGLSQYRIAGDISPVTWRNASGAPMRTHEGHLFTQNIYKDWVRKADAGHFSSKGIHSRADLNKWLKRIGLHHVEDIS